MNIELSLDYRTVLANRAQPVRLAVRFVADQLAQARPKPTFVQQVVAAGHSSRATSP
jgi:hypothetical protein